MVPVTKSIHLTNEDLEVPFTDEDSVLELLIKSDIEIDHSCGGMGSCGTCHIFIKSDLKVLPKRNEIEQERADDLKFSDDERLACQLCPMNGLAIRIP